MKLIPILSAGICSLGLLAVASAQQAPVKFELPQVGATAAPAQTAPAATAIAAPVAPAPKFSEAQLMEVYGWMLGTRMNLAELEFTPAQIEGMAKGLAIAASGRQLTYDAQQIGPQLEELLRKKQETFITKIRYQNLADTANFFTKLKDNKAVKETGSGLRYEVLKDAKGAVAKAGQIATFHYTGSFINGQVFDSSLQAQEGQPVEPVQALVEEGALIAGMTEALLKMPVGSKWKLYIPPHLAYGDEGAQSIPPGATIIFEVELFSVADAPKQAGAKK
ncbi:MAG: FKBP-type peptidyl-prolyl cis-trans isomerase [Candidatus Didemnitutus sp.]|nr:FKBP-type peptidyl-prolyl cis-trans isomerase [Candidatus Didemnitutus sp.]